MIVIEHNAIVRDYEDTDYSTCEKLVSNAWAFDKHFHTEELLCLVKYIYTMGSISGSNFLRVLDINHKVVGFLFGVNEKISLPKHDLQKLSAKLGILKRLFTIKGIKLGEKIDFFSALNRHEINRAKIVERGKSEIVLFVIDPAHQGKGYGKTLFTEFECYCKQSHVASIVVETNKLGASDFYEHLGFVHKGNFYSPLHAYVTRSGQACMYEYLLPFPK